MSPPQVLYFQEPDGSIRLTLADLGLCRITGASTHDPAFVDPKRGGGIPGYQAPEQRTPTPTISAFSDVWAFALLLLQVGPLPSSCCMLGLAE